ncbi:MAG: 1-deoxy-D-xylulose-5-phosphate synthase [Longicatena sp.]|nr:1-deoxy-D-xylulose-5-phosphate synthase [Longicatena sp.]
MEAQKSWEHIKDMNIDQLNALAQELREFLLESVSKTGGHLSSNLGIVEMTIALHYVFESPKDKIIFDVGHQSYIHKLLTGRAQQFSTLRQYNGISGFQKRCESAHDPWEAGHSSTSLSAALGMAIARDLNHEDHRVIACIGDGALSGGMSLEALNQIGSEQRDMIILFNDNNMSISHNVGAMSDAFTRLRTSKGYNVLKEDLKQSLSKNNIGKTLLKSMQNVKNTLKENVVDTSIFGNFNLEYIGPVDGHDIAKLIHVFEHIKHLKGPVVVHVLTTKGKGYSYAEADKTGAWHGVGPFDLETGKSISKSLPGMKSWSEIISTALCDLAKDNKKIVAITPAMISGSKLQNFFDLYPERSFDCGIAEEHAMTFAAGLATNQIRPFISIYSSFIQRAYDQINHDVARMKLPVVIGIDRCSLVGEDGETHHGVFDIALLRNIPNLILSQPKDAKEAYELLYTAFQQELPFVIRYPRGSVHYEQGERKLLPIGSWEVLSEGKITVITYGDSVSKVLEQVKKLPYPVQVINARFFKPIDEKLLHYLIQQKQPIIVYENDILIGGLSSAILEYINDHQYHVDITRIGIEDHFVTHGNINKLKEVEQIDLNTLMQTIEQKYQEDNYETR